MASSPAECCYDRRLEAVCVTYALYDAHRAQRAWREPLLFRFPAALFRTIRTQDRYLKSVSSDPANRRRSPARWTLKSHTTRRRLRPRYANILKISTYTHTHTRPIKAFSVRCASSAARENGHCEKKARDVHLREYNCEAAAREKGTDGIEDLNGYALGGCQRDQRTSAASLVLGIGIPLLVLLIGSY
ncbi:hypothetical protein FN846DRAFT_570328 [Sphaerosporella brunnea]|uniref:Uncharacterized protein n=1 Tax=Sphaerosporella brunnea TaxID=1250544 RepID=A0A5J5F3C5_9PEZI|nr:hypothetical protein FN846DRAFT_570328 [Sphaerosporella brunnea]